MQLCFLHQWLAASPPVLFPLITSQNFSFVFVYTTCSFFFPKHSHTPVDLWVIVLKARGRFMRLPTACLVCGSAVRPHISLTCSCHPPQRRACAWSVFESWQPCISSFALVSLEIAPLFLSIHKYATLFAWFGGVNCVNVPLVLTKHTTESDVSGRMQPRVLSIASPCATPKINMKSKWTRRSWSYWA